MTRFYLNDEDITEQLAAASERLDLHAEIQKQRDLGAEVIAPLSMLRCSECGNLLDSFGYCKTHGLLDPEATDAR